VNETAASATSAFCFMLYARTTAAPNCTISNENFKQLIEQAGITAFLLYIKNN